MSTLLIRRLMIALASLVLQAQVYQSHFAEISVDRSRMPAGMASEFTVEPASGALDAHIPLGPGIGEGGVRFVPTILAHHAPQISWVRTSLPSNQLEASSQATFSLLPGCLDLKLTAHGDSDARTFVSNFELWNGINGTFQLDRAFPEFEDPIEAETVIRAFGYRQEAVGSKPHLQGQAAERLVKYATDGSLILALHDATCAPEILTPITWGTGDRTGRGNVASPSRILLIRQDIAYEFTTLYDSRFAGQWGNIWFSRFRLTGIRNKFGDRVQITYQGNGVGGPPVPNRMGYKVEAFRADQATGHAISLAVEPGGGARPRMRISYATPDAIPLSYELDFQVEVFDLVPEGVYLWDRREVPEWCELSRRLLIHQVTHSGTDEWIRIAYASPRFSFNGVSLNHRLVSGVTWSNGRSLDLEWKDYPYRRNDARNGTWQGYFTRYFDLPGGKEKDKRNWCYGVTSLVERDTVTAAERMTSYERKVPIPRWDTRNSWLEPAEFHTAIIHPDGQVTLEKYVPPMSGYDGGPGSPDPIIQERTLAHLRHTLLERRHYARGVDWRADLYGPPDRSSAYRTLQFQAGSRFFLGQEGYPGRSIEEGAYPQPSYVVTTNRDSRVEETILRFWNDAACAMGDQTRILSRDHEELYQERLHSQFYALPRLGILARSEGETRMVTSDRAPGAPRGSAEPPKQWYTHRQFDRNERAMLNRVLGSSAVGPAGPGLETRFVYQADEGPQARLVASAELCAPGLRAEAGGAEYDHDDLGRMVAIRPKGVPWRYVQTLDGLGRSTTRTDENGLSTTYGWDDAGRLTSIEPPSGEVATRISYDPDGRGRTIQRGVQDTVLRTNAFGERIREVRSGSAGTAHRNWGRDPAGRVTWETVWLPGEGADDGWQGEGEGPRTRYDYDGRGRLVRVVNPDGETTSTCYGPGTRTVTTAAGSTVYRFDHLERLVQVTDPLGHITTYCHDPDGRINMATQTDPATGATQTRTWSYNDLGWLTATEQPESGVTTYSQFTLQGRPQITTRAGDGTGPARVLRATYDSLGRMLSHTSDDGSVVQDFSYDARDAGGRSASGFGLANGKPTYARDRGVEVFRSYQGPGGALSALDIRIWPDGSVGAGTPVVFPQTFTVDGYWNRVGASAGQSTVTTGYDAALGVATAVARNGTQVASGQLDLGGNLASLTYANGSSAAYHFDPDQIRPHAISYAKGATRLGSWTFGYDSGGQLLSNGEDAYQYDPLGRLTQSIVSRLATGGLADPRQTVTQSFRYDAFGNPTSSVAAGALPSSALSFYNLNNFTFNAEEQKVLAARNRLPATASGVVTGAGYDPQGNLTAIWKQAGIADTAQTFSYDALGRMVQSWDGARGVTEKYGYTPDGLRTVIEQWRGATLVKRSCNLYNDAGQLVSRHEAQGATATPVWKRDLVYLGRNPVAEFDAGGLHALHADHLGSPRQVTDGNGAVEACQKYLPFGATLDQQGGWISAKGFTSHEQTDGSGLVYMRGRFYLPQYHRFASPDPGPDQHPEDPQRWNRYAYVQNSPIAKLDPDGQEQFDITFRAFIPQATVGGFRGDNRGFSADPVASSRVSVGVCVETDPAINKGNPMIGIPHVMLSPTHFNLGSFEKISTGPLLPQVTVTQNAAGTVNVNVKEDMLNPFIPTYLHMDMGIKSDLNISINQNATHAWVQGTLSGAPSFEVNFTPKVGPTTNVPLQAVSQNPFKFVYSLSQKNSLYKNIIIDGVP